MDRDSFIFYRSFYEAAKPLSKANRAELFDCICEFALNQTETKPKPIVEAMFNLIRPQLEANYNRYLTGCKGGRPPKETKDKPNDNQTITKPKPNVNVNVNDNVNKNDNPNVNENEKGKTKRFTPPSVQDVWYYMQEKGLPATTTAAELSKKFVDHYTSNGWKVGKNKMIDWRAAVRSNWLKDNEQHKPQRDISKL